MNHHIEEVLNSYVVQQRFLRGLGCYTDMHWEHRKQKEAAFQLEDNTIDRIQLSETCSRSI